MYDYFSRLDHSLRISLGRKPSVWDYIKHSFVIVMDYVFFGATLTDHFELTMSNKTLAEKKELMTWRLSKRFIFTADSPELITKYRKNKNVMYERLKSYLGRELISLKDSSEDEIRSFIVNNPRFLFKPNDQSCGIGIRLVNSADLSDDELSVMIKEGGLFDALIIQHPQMAELCPASVNTLRVFTMKTAGTVHFIGVALRIGNGKDVVDNYSAGGLVCAVDIETGRIMGAAEDMFGRRSRTSPSGVDLLSFSIPKWDELKQFVIQMAEDFELNYVAWDVAICQNGFQLVEANPRGMVNLIQIAGNGGKRRQYESLMRLIKQ